MKFIEARALRRIRLCLGIFIPGLVFSGLTAFPLDSELRWLVPMFQRSGLLSLSRATRLLPWLERVHDGLTTTNARFPFLAYGTDWLAFAHLVIAVAFIGPYRDPVRNRWVVTFGLIACAGVIPLALIAGQIRGIPLPWRFLDCSFGVFGAIPLLIATRSIDFLDKSASLND